LYLLTNIDIPWQDDPQREHPDKREHFWEIYKREVATTQVPVVEISGDRETRRKRAVDAIQNIL
jgi:nicotinamide riboside kinase